MGPVSNLHPSTNHRRLVWIIFPNYLQTRCPGIGRREREWLRHIITARSHHDLNRRSAAFGITQDAPHRRLRSRHGGKRSVRALRVRSGQCAAPIVVAVRRDIEIRKRALRGNHGHRKRLARGLWRGRRVRKLNRKVELSGL